ncbi:MAG TPA: hypothetical protein ENG75_00705, partial [Nitrospirae bacterium]|nr:hypothetical protein [Nitrospirota bacterium]
MDSKTEIIKDLRKAMEFYQELGFEHLPVKLSGTDGAPTSATRSKVSERSGVYTADKAKALKELQKEIGDCRRCGLSKGRANIVFGEGSPDAELMFVGEGPG